MPVPIPGTGDAYTAGLIEATWSEKTQAWSFAAAGASTIGIDTASFPRHQIAFVDAATPTISLNNGVNGRRVILCLKVGVNEVTVTWPGTCKFIGDAAPGTPVNNMLTIEFYLDQTLGLWVEQSRVNHPF